MVGRAQRRSILINPTMWEGRNRTIYVREIRIEQMCENPSMLSSREGRATGPWLVLGHNAPVLSWVSELGGRPALWGSGWAQREEHEILWGLTHTPTPAKLTHNARTWHSENAPAWNTHPQHTQTYDLLGGMPLNKFSYLQFTANVLKVAGVIIMLQE